MLARAIKNSNPNILGLNILNNNGEVAYQSVFHSHIHLIPRYSKKKDLALDLMIILQNMIVKTSRNC